MRGVFRSHEFQGGDAIAEIPGLGTALILRAAGSVGYKVVGQASIPGFMRPKGNCGMSLYDARMKTSWS